MCLRLKSPRDRTISSQSLCHVSGRQARDASFEEVANHHRDELVRSDLREDQAGVDITLDVQILDLSTCEPLTDVFFEVWNANAYG